MASLWEWHHNVLTGGMFGARLLILSGNRTRLTNAIGRGWLMIQQALSPVFTWPFPPSLFTTLLYFLFLLLSAFMFIKLCFLVTSPSAYDLSFFVLCLLPPSHYLFLSACLTCFIFVVTPEPVYSCVKGDMKSKLFWFCGIQLHVC